MTRITTRPFLVWITALVLLPFIGWAEGVSASRAEKFEKEILAFEEADLHAKPAAGGILFTGSSSIRLWKNLSNDFAGLPVINRGFGGSQLIDLRYFAERIVKPYAPRMIVVYSGGNDIHAGKSPEEVLGDFKAFAEWVQRTLPGTRLAYISIAPNPKRWKEVRRVQQANRLIREYMEGKPGMNFINVFPHMLGRNGLPRPEIFSPDRLHMNDRGYALWRRIVRPYLYEH